MDIQEKKHLSKTLKEFSVLGSRKYKKGIKEHGGRLWLKEGLIGEAKSEVVDLWSYLCAIEEQIKNSGIKLGKLKDE